MNNALGAVISCFDKKGLTIAQLWLNQDGTIDTFGDPSAAAEMLALVLRFGPKKLEELTPILTSPTA